MVLEFGYIWYAVIIFAELFHRYKLRHFIDWFFKEKRGEVWPSHMTKAPIPPENETTQRRCRKFRIDLGRLVGGTTVIKLVWFNRFRGSKPSHSPQQQCNETETPRCCLQYKQTYLNGYIWSKRTWNTLLHYYRINRINNTSSRKYADNFDDEYSHAPSIKQQLDVIKSVYGITNSPLTTKAV